MNLIFFDQNRQNLLPFTYTRPIAEFRCGILTLSEKWSKRVDSPKVSYLTEDYLSEKYPANYEALNYYINGSVLANDELIGATKLLKEGELLMDEAMYKVLSFCSADKLKYADFNLADYRKVMFSASYLCIDNIWDIFAKNGKAIEEDYTLLTEGRVSQPLDKTCTHIGSQLFIEEGAKVQAAILNSTSGPIYIGKNAEIMEGSVVRGALAMCEGAVLKLATKIYGPTTIGPHSKVGGEVNNSVLFGYSNKGHDGFLGNSVLGEWCNLGADTNVSNLKNNYAEIKLWNFEKRGFKPTGLQFCGMMMGDHSKSGINTMFNTATVVGVSANIYGGGFPRNFIPSFAWGGSEKWMVYRFEKAMEVAAKVMERRSKKLDEVEMSILKHIFDETATHRNF
ncbi:MAG: UDP-N-acetylglucosamine diphosphorylase/glucosamine-1-phosphate N-acetyltransferase [Vicingaceae bacterium]|jgi:UDP-N-acetylglucosamine diphosphorylase/glucosamine-1-phosphate N-acetyltransferase